MADDITEVDILTFLFSKSLQLNPLIRTPSGPTNMQTYSDSCPDFHAVIVKHQSRTVSCSVLTLLYASLFERCSQWEVFHCS